MKLLDVLRQPELADASQALAVAIAESMGTVRSDVALHALFAVFVGVARTIEIDPGMTFETLLAHLDRRIAATHRGSTAIN